MIIQGTNLVGGRYSALSSVTTNLVLNLDAGNIASYPGSGTSWTDTIGSKVFTLVNGPTYNSGNGGSIVFEPASSQHADGPSFASTLSNWTVETWVYHDSTNMGGSGSPCLVTELYLGNPLNFTLGNTQDTFPYIQAGSFNGGWASTPNAAATLTSGHWYQVAGSWDGNIIRLYINGMLASSTDATGFSVARGGAGIRLMGRWDNAQWWGGRLSVVRIYDTDIGSSGVLQNFNADRSRFGL